MENGFSDWVEAFGAEQTQVLGSNGSRMPIGVVV